MRPSAFPRKCQKRNFHCFLIWNEDSFQGREQSLFEIILHVGRVTKLQSWVDKKSCHGQTLRNKCSVFDCPSKFEALLLALHAISFQTFFVLHSSEVILEWSKSCNRNENCLFSFPWEFQESRNGSFLYASHIHNFPNKLTPMSMYFWSFQWESASSNMKNEMFITFRNLQLKSQNQKNKRLGNTHDNWWASLLFTTESFFYLSTQLESDHAICLPSSFVSTLAHCVNSVLWDSWLCQDFRKMPL